MIDMTTFVGGKVMMQLKAPVFLCERGAMGPQPAAVQGPDGQVQFMQAPFMTGEIEEANDKLCRIRYATPNNQTARTTVPCDLIMAVTVMSDISLAH